MATYRMLVLIPSKSIHPSGGATITVPDSLIKRCFNAATRIPQLVFDYSNGQCILETDVKVIQETLVDTAYSYRDPPYETQYYHSPSKVATDTGDLNYYDFFMVFSAPELVNANTFSGLTTTAGVWIEADEDMEEIAIHELLHWFTVHLTAQGYTNFPTCGGEPAAHCAETYGYPHYSHPSWFEAFFRGTVGGTLGINATGWTVQTPTQLGSKSRRIFHRLMTPWGRMRMPKVIPS